MHYCYNWEIESKHEMHIIHPSFPVAYVKQCRPMQRLYPRDLSSPSLQSVLQHQGRDLGPLICFILLKNSQSLKERQFSSISSLNLDLDISINVSLERYETFC